MHSEEVMSEDKQVTKVGPFYIVKLSKLTEFTTILVVVQCQMVQLNLSPIIFAIMDPHGSNSSLSGSA